MKSPVIWRTLTASEFRTDAQIKILRHRARAGGGLLRFGWKRRDHREVSEECGSMRIKNS